MMCLHTVRPGETLTSLSRDWYGDGCHAMTIYSHNRDVLDNPNVLPPGVQLVRPYVSLADLVL